MRFGDYSRSTTVEEDARVHAARKGDPDNGASDGYGLHDVAEGEWALWLPHDCDEWTIACGDATSVLDEGRRFLASVQAALDHIEIASRSGE